MTEQDAKFELKQYKLLSHLQQNAINDLKELEDRVYSLRSGNDEQERIQNNKISNSIETAYEKVWGKRVETADKVASYIKQKENIIFKIKTVESPLSDILFKRYVQGKRMERICLELHYDYYYLSKLHSRALKKYAEL